MIRPSIPTVIAGELVLPVTDLSGVTYAWYVLQPCGGVPAKGLIHHEPRRKRQPFSIIGLSGDTQRFTTLDDAIRAAGR